ncbi:MAG: 2-hydroxychromene-2-carboxylate isomerase [Rhodospirillales bacterium]|nr:2-hydroxychromene-2-carboxylate isomerase [Rhodospirillales bacterium]
MTDAIDFWFSTGSTYAYLTVSRLQKVEATTGVAFNWRPFSVRTIMREQNNTPFATKPIKMGYMWRDIERRAAMYGLEAKVPAPYPLQQFDLANRLALLGLEEGWGKSYVVASYRRWFVDGQEPGLEPNLSASLGEVGQDPVRVVGQAQSDRIGGVYVAATDEARRLGIFGSPTFVVRGELFWGDDRLDDAICWLKHGRLVA